MKTLSNDVGMILENLGGQGKARSVTESLGQAAEGLLNSLYLCILGQPVVLFHVKEYSLHFLGKWNRAVFQRSVLRSSEFIEGKRWVVAMPIPRQNMVEKDINGR